MQRQNDGILPPFPIWDDVQSFDGKPWKGRVDVVSGGFPCQDISAAGKGAGIDGSRSGMWFHMARIVSEVRPNYVFVENSPMLTSRGLGRVLGDLASMGYDAEWGVLGAVNAAAPHERKRIWIVAYANLPQCHRVRCAIRSDSEHTYANASSPWWRQDPAEAFESNVGRMANGVASRVDRLKAIGNGQVSIVAALAFKILSARLNINKNNK
jgi:DNA (cytosine-5)-methyltransferase 1